MKLDSLFHSPQVLPVISPVVQDLLATLGNEDFHIEALAQLISRDAVITARLLQLANSAYFELPQAISTVSQAVHHLGFVNVRSTVIRIGLMSSFSQLDAQIAQQFWRHSLHMAAAAQHWAALPAVQFDSELAHVLALLYPIGQLMLYQSLPADMAALDQQAHPLSPQRVSLERAKFGFSYTDVGAELLRRWRFPAVFVHVLADPPRAQPDVRLAALVRMAAWQVWYSEQVHDNDTTDAADNSWPTDLAATVPLLPEQGGNHFPPWAALCGTAQAMLI
jgi:HD-like signal output (HDOD) protein